MEDAIMRKITGYLAVAAALVVALLLFCGIAMAETGGTDGNITWSRSDYGVLTISGTGEMKDYTYNYSYNYNTYITSAPWGASVTRVVIENGITSIGSHAFRAYTRCDYTSYVEIPALGP